MGQGRHYSCRRGSDVGSDESRNGGGREEQIGYGRAVKAERQG